MAYTLEHGDCRALVVELESNSVDAVITDPPYELNLMEKPWDRSGVTHEAGFWADLLRVLKPGGFIVAFASPKRQHRMASAIEQAGGELRATVPWIYERPYWDKSTHVDRKIDAHLKLGRSDSIAVKKVNEMREGEVTVRRHSQNGHRGLIGSASVGPSRKRSEPITPEARQYKGYCENLSPAHEVIVFARKPLEGSLAENLLAHQTGALNVGACRFVTVSEKSVRPADVMMDENLAGVTEVGDCFFVPKASRSERTMGLDTGEKPHPTTKPLTLMRHLVRLTCPNGGLVFDPFSGSGTTGMACILEDRRFHGIELLEEHVGQARRRLRHAARRCLAERAPGELELKLESLVAERLDAGDSHTQAVYTVAAATGEDAKTVGAAHYRLGLERAVERIDAAETSESIVADPPDGAKPSMSAARRPDATAAEEADQANPAVEVLAAYNRVAREFIQALDTSQSSLERAS